MKKLHPRLGLLEVIEESPLFYRVSTNYDFWIPKADFVPDDAKPRWSRSPSPRWRKSSPQWSGKDAEMKPCEANPDHKQCPNEGTHPVIFAVPGKPRVQWLCTEHYDVLVPLGLAKDAVQ